MVKRSLAALLLAALAASGAGCGQEGTVASGATVTVYVSAPLHGSEAEAGRRLCDEAREQAAQGDGDELELRVICLDAAGPGGKWTLARVGANARRATEDATAVAYLGEPDPEARRQSRPIVEAAEIAELRGLTGREAIAKITMAIRDGDASDPREAVFDAVG